MNGSSPPPEGRSNVVLDGLALTLFIVFVVLLFLAYLGLVPTIIYPGVASIPLVGSLALMFWTNWSLDRQGRRTPVEPSG